MGDPFYHLTYLWEAGQQMDCSVRELTEYVTVNQLQRLWFRVRLASGKTVYTLTHFLHKVFWFVWLELEKVERVLYSPLDYGQRSPAIITALVFRTLASDLMVVLFDVCQLTDCQLPVSCCQHRLRRFLRKKICCGSAASSLKSTVSERSKKDVCQNVTPPS